VAIILACIPLADDLNVTQLLSIPTGLILFLVVFETIASLERGARPVESWRYIKPSSGESLDAPTAGKVQDPEGSKIDE
jgi:hypothetical protein